MNFTPLTEADHNLPRLTVLTTRHAATMVATLFQDTSVPACLRACMPEVVSPNERTHMVVPICTTLVALLLLLLVFDYKLMPFSWSLSMILHIVPNLKKMPPVQLPSSAAAPKRNPLFEAISVTQRSSFGELDFNLHKSNSTFFADADVSRTKLIFSLFSPALRRKDDHNILRILHKEGHKGGLKFILSAVHATFQKEVLPLQSYSVDSRVHSWDRKWLVVETCFWKRSQNRTSERGLICSVISKLVIKKGRFTVEPRRMLVAAGLIDPVFPTMADTQQSVDIRSTIKTIDMDGSRKKTTEPIYRGWDAQLVEEQRERDFAMVRDWISFSAKLTQTAA